jgi:hypothetical protein
MGDEKKTENQHLISSVTSDRFCRRAAALRANLMRRKQHQKEREQGCIDLKT